MSADAAKTGPGDAVLCEDLHKSFGPVHAVDGADLSVPTGAIVGLIGENGAGKSTMVRLIAGELEADGGRIEVAGSVGLVRQQLSLVPELTVLENVAFGAETLGGRRPALARALGRIEWRGLRERTAALAESTGLEIPLGRPAGELPAGVQQRAEILGALLRGAAILLLDEPTSYLTPHEVDRLFAVIRGLTDQGLSAVFISHKLREVAAHCDEVTVMRKGCTVARFGRRPFELAAIGRAMTDGGQDPEMRHASPPRPSGAAAGAPRLSAIGGRLWLAAGEVVGVAGVAGNGQEELFATLGGIGGDPRFHPVEIDGSDVGSTGTRDRRRLGLRLIPSDVRAAGPIAGATVTDNVMSAMAEGEFRTRLGFLRRRAATEATGELIEQAQIVATGPAQLAGELSGGNQQRLLVARELREGARILIAHEPTRGVDFAAAAAIHERLRSFVGDGGAVLLLTSDLDELLALSARIHVLRDGDLSVALPQEEVTLGRLGELLGGLDEAPPPVEVAV